jgi:hypothetical protein
MPSIQETRHQLRAYAPCLVTVCVLISVLCMCVCVCVRGGRMECYPASGTQREHAGAIDDRQSADVIISLT